MSRRVLSIGKSSRNKVYVIKTSLEVAPRFFESTDYVYLEPEIPVSCEQKVPLSQKSSQAKTTMTDHEETHDSDCQDADESELL